MKNDETTGMAFGLAIIGAGLLFAAAFVFAVATFFALILTVLCIVAWNKGLDIGKWFLPPEEARAFIVFSILGGIGLSAFAAFTSAIFGFEIREDFWGFIFWTGYDLGAFATIHYLGVEEQKKAEQEKAEAALLPPPPVLPVPPQRGQKPAEPFQYASWDDEDEFK